MRILVLNEAADYSLGASYARAFRQLGHEVTSVNPLAELSKSAMWRFRPMRRLFERQIIGRFNRQWIEELANITTDLVWVGKGAWAVPWLWRELKSRRPGVALVCYNADNPITSYSRGGNRPWITESISSFDFYATYNKNLIEPLQKAGARRVVRIPFGWDSWLHPELDLSEEDRQKFECDIVFIGNGDRHRENWIGNIIRASEGNGWNFAVYGNWTNARDPEVLKVIKGGPLLGISMVKATRSANLALNILRVQNEGSHNMRTFEIPGCGGLMLSQNSLEQNEFFPEFEAAVYFNNADDAVRKIMKILRETSRLQMMRDRARDIARHNTYVHRAEALLAVVAEPTAF